MNQQDRVFNFSMNTKLANWFGNQWETHPTRIIGFGLVFLSILFFFSVWLPGKWFEDFSANLASETLSIAVTVLIIDALNERRQNKQLKEQLILQMSSIHNDVTDTAIKILTAHKWLYDGSLKKINLEGANLKNSKLKGANLEKANLQFARLEGAKLNKAILKHANLRRAKLNNAKLRKANLKHTQLMSASLINAILEEANLRNADLGFANLQDAMLMGADLEDSRLMNANFGNADLWEANLKNADFWDANFENANLELANMDNAKNWTKEQLLQAKSLREAVMPDGRKYEEWIQDMK